MSCYTFLYARRSGDEKDRQVLSLPAQEAECRAFASHRDFRIDEVIPESHSARKPGRPLFQAMLEHATELARAGTQVRILSHKPDRLLRNLADWAKLNELVVDLGVELHFVTGSFANNAQGQMAFGINVLFAKYYVDNLSEEVRKGLREKISRGEWPALAPLGYRNVIAKDAPERIVEDAIQGPLVRRAFEYYATGEYSIDRLADRLYVEGLGGSRLKRRLSKGYLQDRVLKNPFYCGLMRYKGQLHRGVHSPLISLELFEKVQHRLHDRSRPRQQRHHFRYNGLFQCGHCGGKLFGELKKNRYLYYHCTRKGRRCLTPYVREEELQYLFVQALERDLKLHPEVIQALQAVADQLQEELGGETGFGTAALQEQQVLLERKRGALLDLRLAGQITEAEHAAKRNELVQDEARLAEGLRKLELPQRNARDAISWFVRICNDVQELFTEAVDGEIQALLSLVGSNYRFWRGEVKFEPVTPFSLAAQVHACPQWSGSENEVRTFVSKLQHLDVAAMMAEAHRKANARMK